MPNDHNLHVSLSEKYILHERGYNLIVKLGEGRFSKVYLTDFQLNQNQNIQHIRLACKIIDTAKQSNFSRKNLSQELNIIIKLNHPHIVQIHSILQLRGKFYIFMRSAENGDLLDYILNNGPVAETLARFWTRQIALALQYLHLLEIAHRDIKCENILVTRNNNIKLTDFGLSRLCVDKNYQHILSDTYCGTLSYSSPQVLIGDPYNPKANDMWSLGSVIYVMLNKATPFGYGNIKHMINKQVNKNFIFRKFNCTKEVQNLVHCLLEPSEELRYKVEQVLNSPWISMNSELVVLSKNEYKALLSALQEYKYIFLNSRSRSSQLQHKRNSIQYYMEFDDTIFDLNSINSKLNLLTRLSK